MPAITRPQTEAQRRKRVEALHQELEWRRIIDGAEGFKYFCDNYIFINSEVDQAQIKFRLFNYQRDMVDTFFSNRFNIVLKGRQIGATTVSMAYGLWLVMTRVVGARILVLSYTQDAADGNLRMARQMYAALPQWLKDRGPTSIGESNSKLAFRGKGGVESYIESLVATARNGASRTATLVIADEFALWSDQSQTYRAVVPTTDAAAAGAGTSAVLIALSTARGGSNLFATLFRQARDGKNRFKAIFYPWHVSRLINPLADEGGIDYSIYNEKRAEASSEPWKFYNEYPNDPEEAFRQSGETFFLKLPSFEECEADWEIAVCGRLVETKDGIEFEEDEFGHLWINRFPKELPNHRFVIGADHSLGRGADYSAAQVLTAGADGRPEIVAYTRTNETAPEDWADELDILGRYFAGPDKAPALLAPEHQSSEGGGGGTVVKRLTDLNYSNLFYYRPPAVRGRAVANRPGFSFNKQTRPLVLNNLATLLAPDSDGVRGIVGVYPQLRTELGTFVRRNYKTASGADAERFAADDGCHDDSVMSLAIAAYVAREENLLPVTQKPQEAPVQTYSVEHIWQDARKKWAKEQAANRRFTSQLKRSLRQRRTN